MEVINGVVKKIFTKEMPADNYGNTVRRSLALDSNGEEVWVGFGAGKSAEFKVPEGDGWYQVAEGDTVSCVVTRSTGKDGREFINGKVKQTEVTNKSGNAPPTPYNGGGAKAATGGKSGGGDSSKGIRVGHAVNCASVLVASGGKFAELGIEKTAINILKLSEKMVANYDEILGIPKEAPKPAPPPPPAAKPASDFDDDIPF